MSKEHAVYVEWRDSAGYYRGPWKDRESLASGAHCSVCRSLGIIVRETAHALVIAGHRGDEEVSGAMAIPKCAIVRRRRVGLPK